MGMATAMDIAGLNETLETQLAMHFRSNCYPPIPLGMIPTAVEAIDAYWEDDYNRTITLPDGVSFRGSDKVSAIDVINSYRLDAWCMEEED
jgi:hypothetical protein